MRRLSTISTWLIFSLVATLVGRADQPLLERDVLPILTKNCMGCHGGLRKNAGLDMRTLPLMLEGGDSGQVIEAGHSEKSELWKRIENDEMPEGDDREKLSAHEKSIIKTWIDAGIPTVNEKQKQVDALLPSGKSHQPLEVAKAIDEHIDRFLNSANLKPTQQSNDAEFLRRLYLDLTGRVPTAKQAAEFLDDPDSAKRSRLIEKLLESQEFGEHFGRTWRDWICPPELPSEMNSGKQPHQQARDLGKWLGERFAADDSWDRIVREILTVKGDIKNQPQLIFYGLIGQDGKSTPDGSARAVASLFMGVQLQCARCHDDPYRDWSQQEYWGLAAFFGRSQGDFKKIEVGKGASKKPGEISIPDSAFKNKGNLVQTAFLDGTRFQAKDNDLRESFVDWLTRKDNPYFAQSFANRVWFTLFSRGIVKPIDDFRDLNPPSHPGLMKLLANEFSASNFDTKHLFRCICNSQAYQRSSHDVQELDEPIAAALTNAFGRMPIRLMNADMLYHSLKLAYGERELDLRVGPKENTYGESAAVGDPYLEFQRKFGTNEEDAREFTHGIAQMLTMINHPRLLDGSKTFDEYCAKTPDTSSKQKLEWLYLSTLSRRPTKDEMAEALAFINNSKDTQTAYNGVLWMLVNRSEYILNR